MTINQLRHLVAMHSKLPFCFSHIRNLILSHLELPFCFSHVHTKTGGRDEKLEVAYVNSTLIRVPQGYGS